MQSIDVGNGPQGIAAGAGGVWVANRLDGTVSRIDPDTNAVVQTIPVGRAPSGVAVAADSVWVSDESEGSVTRVDRRSGDLTTFPLGSQAGNVALGEGALLVSVRGAETAHRGGTLTAVAPDVLDSIDPAVAYFSVSWSILALTNDGLVGFKRVGGLDGATMVPDLARSIPRPTNRGGRTRSGAAGHPVLRRFARASAGLPQGDRAGLRAGVAGRPYYAAIVGTEACRAGSCDLSQGIVADEKAGTVTYHLSTARSRIPVPARAAIRVRGSCRHPGSRVDTTPIPATGPYAIETYTKSEELVLSRNPRFKEWSRAAQPAGFPDRIAWRFGGDDNDTSPTSWTAARTSCSSRPRTIASPNSWPATPGNSTSPRGPGTTTWRSAPRRPRSTTCVFAGRSISRSIAQRSAGNSGRPANRRARFCRRTSQATFPTAPTRDPISRGRGSSWQRLEPQAHR